MRKILLINFLTLLSVGSSFASFDACPEDRCERGEISTKNAICPQRAEEKAITMAELFGKPKCFDFNCDEISDFVLYMQTAERQSVPKVGPVSLNIGKYGLNYTFRNHFSPYAARLDRLHLKGEFYEDTVRNFMRRFLRVNAAIKVSIHNNVPTGMWPSLSQEQKMGLMEEFSERLVFCDTLSLSEPFSAHFPESVKRK